MQVKHVVMGFVMTCLVPLVLLFRFLSGNFLDVLSIFGGVFIIVFQAIAFSPWRFKEMLFKFTDYIYYALIGGMVGIGSLMIDQRDVITEFKIMVESSRLEARTSDLASELADLREKRERAAKFTKNIDQKMLQECKTELFSRRLDKLSRRSEDKIAKDMVPPLNLCTALVERFGEEEVFSITIKSRENELEKSNAKLKDLENKKHGLRTGKMTLEEMRFRFLWIPFIILLGISIKLGKTTCSLVPKT